MKTLLIVLLAGTIGVLSALGQSSPANSSSARTQTVKKAAPQRHKATQAELGLAALQAMDKWRSAVEAGTYKDNDLLSAAMSANGKVSDTFLSLCLEQLVTSVEIMMLKKNMQMRGHDRPIAEDVANYDKYKAQALDRIQKLSPATRASVAAAK